MFTPATALAEGEHTLALAATDAAGNVDPSPLVRHFRVDTTAPETTISGGPSGTTDEAAPTFTFTASEPGVSFRCSIDSLTLTPCGSPFTVAPALADGAHSFRVQATDAAGNVEATVRQRDFTVEPRFPTPRSPPDQVRSTNDSTPSFEFSVDEAGLDLRLRPRRRRPSLACAARPSQAAALADGASHLHGQRYRRARPPRPDACDPDLHGRHDRAADDSDRRPYRTHQRPHAQLRIQLRAGRDVQLQIDGGRRGDSA